MEIDSSVELVEISPPRPCVFIPGETVPSEYGMRGYPMYLGNPVSKEGVDFQIAVLLHGRPLLNDLLALIQDLRFELMSTEIYKLNQLSPEWLLILDNRTGLNSIQEILYQILAWRGCIQLAVQEKPEPGDIDVHCKPSLSPILPGYILSISVSAQVEARSIATFITDNVSQFSYKGSFQKFHHLKPPDSMDYLRHLVDHEFTVEERETFLRTMENTDAGETQIVCKTLQIPCKAVTFLIGRKGMKIEQIRLNTGARIKIHSMPEVDPFGEDKENLIPASMRLQKIAIEGTPQQVEEAESLVRNILAARRMMKPTDRSL